MKIRDVWGDESKGEFVTATFKTLDSWDSFSGDYFLPNKKPISANNGLV